MTHYLTQRDIINDMVNKRNNIIPIIGEDTIVFKDNVSGKEIPFQEFILNEFQNKYPHVILDDAIINSMKERGYYGLSLMAESFNKGRFLDDFMEFVNSNIQHIKLKDEVLDFLVTFDFSVIITTICFDIIERQLRGRIEDYKSMWYRLNKENRTLPTRCVYHIFGQAQDGTKWVCNEDSLLVFLLSHNHSEYGAIGLTDFLKEKEKRIFALGCNLPNWLFRFFLQPAKIELNSNTTQGYWINKEKPEDSFENFLKRINFSSDEQVKEILIEATRLLREKLEKEEKEFKSTIDTGERFDVFISYASEDRKIAIRIYEALKNINVKAWFDDRGKGEITPGQKYREKIEKGIRHSAHFMPIITGNWVQKMARSSVLKDETWLAAKCKKSSKTILKSDYSIPVIVKDSVYIDHSDESHPITDTFIENLSQFGLIPSTLFNGVNMITFDGKNYSSFEKIEW